MALGIVNTMSALKQFSGYLKDVSDPVGVSTVPRTVELTWKDPERSSRPN